MKKIILLPPVFLSACAGMQTDQNWQQGSYNYSNPQIQYQSQQPQNTGAILTSQQIRNGMVYCQYANGVINTLPFGSSCAPSSQ